MAYHEEIPVPKLLLQVRTGFYTALAQLNNDPKVAEFLNTWLGQYLHSHPFLTLTLLIFIIMAAVPIGLFVAFAAVSVLAATVGFVLLEAVLLCVGGATLLCVLCGLAVAAFVVSAIFSAFYITTSNVLNLCYSPQYSTPPTARS